MFIINRLNKSRTTISKNYLFNNSKYEKRRNNKTTTTTIISIISNITIPSLSTIENSEQQISIEEPYSAKTGIKTAALLGGMLLFVIIYVLWKARSRICRSKQLVSTPVNNSHLSSSKFDLDYWLKQVDLLEAKEAERNRECSSPYLELPHEAPRNNEIATASWIVDGWRQWRLVQYREQRRLLTQKSNERIESNPVPYRRRRFLLRRLIRRILMPPHPNPSFLIEQSSTLIADLRPSIVNNNLIPPPETLDVQPRRVASWPRLKSAHPQNTAMMSALQTHNARKRLLKRSSKTTTFDI